MIRYRAVTVTMATAASLAIAGTAAAFDCVRVSASLQGLEQSAHSGKWSVIDVSSVDGVQRTFELLGDPVPSDEQAACFVHAYAASGQPASFAVGTGVAGPNGVLMHRNTTTAGDGKGIDRLESSGIVQAYLDAIDACEIEVTA